MRMIQINDNLWINAERIIDIHRRGGAWRVEYDPGQSAALHRDIGEFLQMLHGDDSTLIASVLKTAEQRAEHQQKLLALLDAANQQIKEMQDAIALRETELMALRHSMRLG